MLWNFHSRNPFLCHSLWLGSRLEAFYHVLRSNGRPNEPPTAIKHWRENDSNICRYDMSNRRLQDLVPNFMFQVLESGCLQCLSLQTSTLKLSTNYWHPSKIPKKKIMQEKVWGFCTFQRKLGKENQQNLHIRKSHPRLDWEIGKSLCHHWHLQGGGTGRHFHGSLRWMIFIHSVSVTNSIFATKNGISWNKETITVGSSIVSVDFFEARFVLKSLPLQCS